MVSGNGKFDGNASKYGSSISEIERSLERFENSIPPIDITILLGGYEYYKGIIEGFNPESPTIYGPGIGIHELDQARDYIKRCLKTLWTKGAKESLKKSPENSALVSKIVNYQFDNLSTPNHEEKKSVRTDMLAVLEMTKELCNDKNIYYN